MQQLGLSTLAADIAREEEEAKRQKEEVEAERFAPGAAVRRSGRRALQEASARLTKAKAAHGGCLRSCRRGQIAPHAPPGRCLPLHACAHQPASDHASIAGTLMGSCSCTALLEAATNVQTHHDHWALAHGERTCAPSHPSNHNSQS